MSSITLVRCAFCIASATVMLVGCARQNVGVAEIPAADVSESALLHRRTFTYTGSAQSFKVPAGVTSITVDAIGAAGAGVAGGLGGRVRTTIPVTAGQTLTIYVGGKGSTSSGGSRGGFNGGANGGSGLGSNASGGGGGASDVRRRWLVVCRVGRRSSAHVARLEKRDKRRRNSYRLEVAPQGKYTSKIVSPTARP
jgi:Glycine rich protein